ncbi:MAG: multi-sensor hybrid histidine kinase, partial [Acidimicrobiales bacterium]|nr:multi-sensor hybrid histidine kinase [Acidimicrobiales bacterium]
MTSVADQPGPDASDAHRVSVLRAYGILDTPTNERFDAVVRLAARLCEMPIAMIGLVDADRLWFKARYGDAIQEVPRSEAFSDHALSSGEDFIEVPDLRADERFCHHTAVTEGHCLYYAAVVLRTPDGIPLGTLAVSDAVPRQLTAYQIDALRSLARQVESLLDEHRSTSAPLPGPLASRAALLQGMAASGVATALLDGEGRYSWWSDECAERLGWTAVDVLGRRPQDFLYDEADEVGAGESPLRLRVDHRWHGRRRILHADGTRLEVEAFALALRDADGEVEAYLTGMVASELPPPSSQVGLVESVLVRSEDAVLLCDGRLAGEGPTIAYANPAACAL